MIREFAEEDAEAVAGLLRDVDRTVVVTAPWILHRHRTAPPKAHVAAWVDERGGAVLGFARGQIAWATSEPGVGELWVGVAADARGRGVGGALYERAVGHLRSAAARSAGVWSQREGVAFLERRGHRQRRSSWKSALDLARADLTELAPLERRMQAEGFRVVSLRAVGDRPHDLYELDLATSLDEPSDYPLDSMGYEDWLRTTFEHPAIDWDGSRVVVAGDRLVAWALVGTDGRGRAVNEFTATHPDFRGRGLARLAKLAATAWAREQGVEVIYTGNDAANAPMLAVNRRLGYRRVAELHYLVRPLASGGQPADGAA